jgi:hypothetical protein
MGGSRLAVAKVCCQVSEQDFEVFHLRRGLDCPLARVSGYRPSKPDKAIKEELERSGGCDAWHRKGSVAMIGPLLMSSAVNRTPPLRRGNRSAVALLKEFTAAPDRTSGAPSGWRPILIGRALPRSARSLGEHTKEVLREWLSLSDEESDAIKKQEALV